MKSKNHLVPTIIMVAILVLTASCKKAADNPTVTDIDGNVYHTVTIGTQVWMVENLKTTKYDNGEQIQIGTDDSSWGGLTSGAYCWIGSNIANKDEYGAIYNWFAVIDPRNLAPTGWHVATDADWTTLTTYLGGESVAGGKLKEAGLTHWTTPNTGATNQFGFTALPAGDRDYVAGFYDLGTRGGWWTSTIYNVSFAYSRMVGNDYSYIGRVNTYYQEEGLSVRCVKD
jgi:uncharacterized protein (TIGR02145 family)